MLNQRALWAKAAVSALVSTPALLCAQESSQVLPEVTVTASPFNTGESAQILVPAKVLAGDELRNKLGSTIGDTLENELGVSSSAFGAAASRPVIRGLGGPRVKVMQNGMGVADISTVSEDHAVGATPAAARQVEILRGPAALLYGSGAIGGLVNIVNDRIPTVLELNPTGEAEVRYGTVNRLKGVSASVDGSVGQFGLHVDANLSDADDYKIPDSAQEDNPDSASGRLPFSYTRQDSVGFGGSYIDDWGHIGASIGSFNNRYGIPSEEGAKIELEQMRYDTEMLVKRPFRGIESARVKLGYTDYEHTELDTEDVAETDFSNRAFESRWEFTHRPIAGWRGIFGLQTENSKFSALSAEEDESNTVPETKSQSYAAFLVEEKEIGPFRINAGARLESVKREPVAGRDRSFDLGSYSLGGLWTFMPGYSVGATLSIAQRAPTAEELYSSGAHHATETFDIGDANLNKETSRNVELTLQKTSGMWRWRANLFQNHVDDFIYGRLTGATVAEDPEEELDERIFSQADATIRGAEVEAHYNPRGEGMSVRAFADTSRGKLNDGGDLPLQPADRIGLALGYKQGAWRAGTSVVHAKRQDRLAVAETSTPSYTRLDADLSYSHRYGKQRITWFILGKNLLNEEIRLSTSLLKDVAPLPGRNFILGVRTVF